MVAIETSLKKEDYYYPSRKNAKETLLLILEFMRGAAGTMITQLKKELIKQPQQPMERDPFTEFPEAKNIADKRQQAFVILGLPKDASQADIRKAYLKLSMKWHPDKWSDKSKAEQKYAESVFKVILNAYDTLKAQ